MSGARLARLPNVHRILKLAAMMFVQPRMKMTIPAPMTSRQKGRPRDSWLVACLLRLPRMLLPMTIIQKPRKLKPWDGLSSGQSRAKKFLKMEHSEARRNTAAVSQVLQTRSNPWLLTARTSSDDVSCTVEEEELGEVSTPFRHIAAKSLQDTHL
jgi:hypothetical protein